MMKNPFNSSSSFGLLGAVMAMVMTAAVLLPSESYAAIKCEEIMAKRSCIDNAPRSVQISPGNVISVPAPILDNYPSACWTWNRRFQCIETDPKYYCDSGTNPNTVKRDCSLTAASVNSTITIRGINYITDADYTYRCAFGEFTTNDKLPVNKECIVLDSVTTPSDFVPSAPIGVMPPAPLSTTVATKETKVDEYVCYSPPVTTCSDTCYKQIVNPATGQIEQVAVPCASPTNQCTVSNQQCDASLTQSGSSLSGKLALGPDGRCVSSTTTYACASGEIPRCLAKDNCTLDSTSEFAIQDGGVSYSQEQTYVCSNTTTTCTELANISSCVSPNAWGWDKLSFHTDVGLGLGEYNQAMSKLEGIQKGLKEDDLYIFSGKDLRCHYAVGNWLNTAIMVALVVATMVISGGMTSGLLSNAITSAASTAANAGLIGYETMVTVMASANSIGAAVSIGSAVVSDLPNSKAFGGNCCKDLVVEGSDRWYKLGKCTADEVKLSVAKRKGLVVYLGEYCSKKSGFPIKQCVQKTRSYCAFDDMLALVVNEQGRAQLDAIAKADTATTKTTSPVQFQLFNSTNLTSTKYAGVLNNGRWVKLTSSNNSQVWSWQYPGYCASASAQEHAYQIYMAEVNGAIDTKGTQPKDFDKVEALKQLGKISSLKPYQECPSTAGMAAFLTCSKQDDSCNVSAMPEGPTGVEFDYHGNDVTQADVNWRVQQTRTFYSPGDYGVVSTIPGYPAYAAVGASLNEYITAVGSCKTTGNCIYQFAITDKNANGGMGARKRTRDYAQFPMYTVVPNSAWPAVDYVNKDGSMAPASYANDPNRGRADPLAVSTQRFIFHPHMQTTAITGNIHSAILVEYANKKGSAAKPEDDYRPLLVPTNLPVGTAGWYPYGNTAKHGEYFYLSGACDPNSRWCNYTIEADLNVPRHPWGSAQAPRCWGFTIEQMAALDFDKMDLSRWINSLDLDAATTGLTAEAAEAMTKQTVASVDSFYKSVRNSETKQSEAPGLLALVTNTDILPRLSNDAFSAFTLEAAVPSNWPAYYNDQPNNNPVTNVMIDWGDGTPKQAMVKHAEGRAYLGAHDYGDLEPGRYKVTVTLDTKVNGPQTLTTYVSITPEQGKMPEKTGLDFDAPGTNGRAMGTVTPAETLGGVNQAPANLQQLSPGMAEQFERQDSMNGN